MHIINDISLLILLGKNGVLSHLNSDCIMAISAVRLSDYTITTRQEVSKFCPVVRHLFSDSGCLDWSMDKTTHCSLSELDSLYIAKTKGIPLICSRKDFKLEELAEQQGIQHEATDSFFGRMFKDSAVINMYNLLKAI